LLIEMRKISIACRDKKFVAQLNESATAMKIFATLPISSSVNTWGDQGMIFIEDPAVFLKAIEIYFEIPLDCGVEEDFSKTVVDLGDIAFWPQGKAFCIFFGMTPVSAPGEIRPASAVTVVGKMEGDLDGLKEINNGEKITIERE